MIRLPGQNGSRPPSASAPPPAGRHPGQPKPGGHLKIEGVLLHPLGVRQFFVRALALGVLVTHE
jgi:hypothetical protein